MDALKAKKLHSTVIIAGHFGDRRAANNAHQNNDGAPPETLEPGSRLGRYIILSCLGVGGMGVVYRAHDTELNRTVALKILPPHLCKHPEYLNRFRAEARAQARLNSPHVVTLYSMMELSVGEVLVLEYVEGRTLEQRLRNQGPLPVSEAVRIFDRVLLGVEHIHRMGVVHRDLKPSNIFLTHGGGIKLMDFGVAKTTDDPDYVHQGAMVGTLLYISPEQINSRETDLRSDIYTLGIALFEAVTGRLPFERRTDYALMHAHVQEAPPRPKQYQRRLPTELEWVILKAIEKDPNRRFQSATEFRHAILRLGLMERRHRNRKTKNAADEIPPDGALPEQEIQRYRLTPKNRLLGGFGLDVALVALVASLVFALDLNPLKRANPPAEAAAAVSKPQTVAKARPPAPRTKPPVLNAAKPSAKPRKVAVESKPAAPKRKDKYQALRKAWGG